MVAVCHSISTFLLSLYIIFNGCNMPSHLNFFAQLIYYLQWLQYAIPFKHSCSAYILSSMVAVCHSISTFLLSLYIIFNGCSMPSHLNILAQLIYYLQWLQYAIPFKHSCSAYILSSMVAVCHSI